MRERESGRRGLRDNDRGSDRRRNDHTDDPPPPREEVDTHHEERRTTTAPRRNTESERVTPPPTERVAPVAAKVAEEEPTNSVISADELARNGYTSEAPWENLPADVVVICCSDQRFGRQNREFLRALGFQSPHFIQIPSGLAVFHGLAAVSGFLPKGMNLLLDKAIDLTGVKDVICIAHHDCGGYKAGRFEVIGKLTRRLAGMDIQDVQTEQLHRAARDVQLRMGNDTTVRAFYSDVVGNEGDQQVKFSEIDLIQRSLRKKRKAS